VTINRETTSSMRRLATTSKRSPSKRIGALCGGLALFASPSAWSLPSIDEALKLVFADCKVVRNALYLTDAQVQEVKNRSSEDGVKAMVPRYEPQCEKEKGVVAYLDSHRVRTKYETLLIVVGLDGRASRVEVVSFLEPPDYIPRALWYAQFKEKELSDDLKLKRSIAPVTGATLTANATVAAVRRILAVHHAVSGKSSK
jgi:Na+-translocating ferredoxin:NAD+ oxidoreductase RnfG subunit